MNRADRGYVYIRRDATRERGDSRICIYPKRRLANKLSLIALISRRRLSASKAALCICLASHNPSAATLRMSLATLRCRSTASQATPSPFATLASLLLRYRSRYRWSSLRIYTYPRSSHLSLRPASIACIVLSKIKSPLRSRHLPSIMLLSLRSFAFFRPFLTAGAFGPIAALSLAFLRHAHCGLITLVLIRGSLTSDIYISSFCSSPGPSAGDSATIPMDTRISPPLNGTLQVRVSVAATVQCCVPLCSCRCQSPADSLALAGDCLRHQAGIVAASCFRL